MGIWHSDVNGSHPVLIPPAYLLLGGTSELEATEDGVRCVIVAPLEQEEHQSTPEHEVPSGEKA